MRTSYERVDDPDQLPDHIAKMAPRTVIVDVEPLVASWDTDPATLDRGIASLLDESATRMESRSSSRPTQLVARPGSQTLDRSKSSASPRPASRFEPGHIAACPVPA
jgi:hypothetical protein